MPGDALAPCIAVLNMKGRSLEAFILTLRLSDIYASVKQTTIGSVVTSLVPSHYLNQCLYILNETLGNISYGM